MSKHVEIPGSAIRTGGAAVERRGPPPGVALFVAVAAVSWAGPLIRFTTAPALTVAAWRLIFSVALIAAVLVVRGRGSALLGLTRREWALAVGSGLLLATHFWSWIASLRWTSVGSSVILVNTQPIFAAALSVAFLGERPTGRQWLGIATAVAGAAVIGWGDARGDAAGVGPGAKPLLGDFLAVAGAVFASGYYVIGRRLRRRLDLWTYIAAVYGVAATAMTAAALLEPSTRMTGYATTDWLVFGALAVGPMMLGHTGINYALRYLPAYVANLAALGEAVGAVLIAWLVPAIGEPPSAQVVLGGALIAAGIVSGVGRQGR